MPCPGPHTGRPARPYFYDSHCLTSTETVCNNAASARSGCPDKSDKHHRLCPRVEVSRSEYDHTRGKFVVTVFSRVHSTLQPALSVGRSVGRLVCHTLLFFMILFLGPHCSCPRCLVTSNMAPAHPHATSVAVYPALF